MDIWVDAVIQTGIQKSANCPSRAEIILLEVLNRSSVKSAVKSYKTEG